MDGKSEAEQRAITIDVLKTIFPTFEDEDFDFIDPVEYLAFIQEIAKETNAIINQSLKN